MGEDVHPSAHPAQTGLVSESGSWPSETNPSDPGSGSDAAENEGASDRLSMRARWWHRKNELVDGFLEDRPGRAIRPVSVRGSTKLREEVAREKESGGHRSAPWHVAMNEFLKWYNGYRFAHLRFRSPDGKVVRGQMPNSHQPRYGNVYYAKLKAFERRAVEEFDNLHVALLTFTGSMKNKQGGWRCPADHVREVVGPFGDNVRPALHRALNGKVDRWEYAKVLEHHANGYGHLHLAVFVDGEVTEKDFRPAIDAHLKYCDIAGKEAHDYFSEDLEERPISVRKVDPDLDPNAYEAQGPVGNVGSYIAEYIGAFGGELFDRSMAELQFRSVCWATGTQRVTFSPGANEMIKEDLAARGQVTSEGNVLPEAPARWKPGVEPEDVEAAAKDPDRKVSELLEDGAESWALEGVGRVDEDGEERYDIRRSGVSWVRIEDASHLDQPRVSSYSRPQPRVIEADLSQYSGT